MAPHPWRPTAQKRPRSDPTRHSETTQPEYPPAAYIQAYEAQLVYGPPASGSTSGAGARGGSSAGPSGGGRDGLIKWSGGDEGDEEIWADRYNIIHLLPSLPSTSTSNHRAPSPTSSSSSWDDLPSDEEELFNISGDEAVEAYEREKKRKWLEQLRDARLKEREEQDVEVGRQDEVKSKAKSAAADDLRPIRTLMLHTAKSMYAAPNPKSLEMRILANHAGDARFAFLRGKWAGEWEKVKRRVRVEMGLEKPEGAASVAMLGAYGSDSEDYDGQGDGEEGKEPGSPPPPPPPPESPPSAPPVEGAGEGVVDEANGLVEDAAVDDVPARAVEDVANEAELEEKRRLRREKLEEWKRTKKKG